MAFSEGNDNGMVMPVTPMGGYGGNGWSNSFGGDGWWIILLFILLGNNGWGNGYGNSGATGFIDSSVQRGFDQAAVMNGLTGIQSSITSGFGDVQNSLCNGFAGVEAGANARAMAEMNRSFDLQSQLASCCCENRLGTADLKYTIATENCADRYEAAQNTRDIIENANRNNQAILDKLCALELDAKNDKIADLERQLTMASLAASQGAQTAQILADNSRQTAVLEDYLNPVPRPAYVVANPNCCTANTGCGCGSF